LKRIYIIAGDTSGDLHASKLMKELKKLDSSVQFFGIGGEKMIQQGLSSFVSMNEISVVGFWEVAKKYSFFRNLLEKVKEEILRLKVDLFIAVDYPGFNSRIASFVKTIGIPVVWYIAPQLWAWGEKRSIKFAKNIDELLVVFPFEKEFFEKYNLKTSFVGHPLLDIPEFAGKNEELQRKNQILFMPGSRAQELKKHLPVIVNVNNIIRKELPEYKTKLTIPASLSKSLAQFKKDESSLEITDNSLQAMMESKAGVIKSGTANLEACLIDLPFVMFYKTSFITYLVGKKLINLEFLSLVNILGRKNVILELIQQDAAPDRIFKEIEKLLFDVDYRKSMLRNFSQIKDYLGESGASQKAAEIVFKKLEPNS
jgi:lipid-A-disaccharide synthase